MQTVRISLNTTRTVHSSRHTIRRCRQADHSVAVLPHAYPNVLQFSSTSTIRQVAVRGIAKGRQIRTC
eukprot:6285505-Alexandrium_andersonii.AAC.1